MLADRKTKANPEAMRRAAKQLGVDIPKKRGTEADQRLLADLRLELAKRLASIDENDQVKCGVCDEIATEDTKFCPYCGDLGDGTAIAAVEEVEEVEEADADEDEAAEVEAETEADDSGDEDIEDDGDEDDEGDDDDDEGDDSDDENVVEKPAKPVKEKPATVGIAAKGAKLAKNVDAAMAEMEQELAAAVERIVKLQRNWAGVGWDIGVELKDIRDKQLFKARGYASFKKFAEKELQFTRETALGIIKVVSTSTREDFETIGFTKLRALAPLNDSGVKEELLDAARKGATRKELTESVASATGKKSKKDAAPPAEKGERVTLLGKIGAKRSVVKITDPQSGEVIPSAGVFQAKGLNADAYGEVEISDGVFIRIGMKLGPANDLVGFTTRFVRASDAE